MLRMGGGRISNAPVPGLGAVIPQSVMVFLTLLMFVAWFECHAHEFTFELPDNEKMCFYEALKKDVKCTLEFQVSYENVHLLR